MWLLNVDTLLLEYFIGDQIPEYAILSHVWGEEEVTYQDVIQEKGRDKIGWAKVEGCCRQTKRDGLAYCWIDTCCIDKSSSAELSEAINSMFRWYQDSFICYAYLQDVTDGFADQDFHWSRWFQRGWTLQELIAPANVIFYANHWTDIGSKFTRSEEISRVTDVPIAVLRMRKSIGDYSVAFRMSWFGTRLTTRSEDVAYCLLGIFDINMPLLYGEGMKAFQRLQEEILKAANDATIFAWQDASLSMARPCHGGFVAPHPRYFLDVLRHFRDNGKRLEDLVPAHRSGLVNLHLKLPGAALGSFFEPATISRHVFRAKLPVYKRYKLDLLILPCILEPGGITKDFDADELRILALPHEKLPNGLVARSHKSDVPGDTLAWVSWKEVRQVALDNIGTQLLLPYTQSQWWGNDPNGCTITLHIAEDTLADLGLKSPLSTFILGAFRDTTYGLRLEVLRFGTEVEARVHYLLGTCVCEWVRKSPKRRTDGVNELTNNDTLSFAIDERGRRLNFQMRMAINRVPARQYGGNLPLFSLRISHDLRVESRFEDTVVRSR